MKTEKILLNNTKMKNKNFKLLIAEDEEASSIFLGLILKDKFESIIYVNSGIKAIEAIKLNPDIDMVLMDIKMPRMNGYEATRKIRQFNKDVIIIAQTAYAMIGDKEKSLEAGCNDYITKPIDKKQLVDLVDTYMK